MTAVVVVFAFIVAFSAIICGHQGEDLPRFALLRRTNRPRSNR